MEDTPSPRLASELGDLRSVQSREGPGKGPLPVRERAGCSEQSASRDKLWADRKWFSRWRVESMDALLLLQGVEAVSVGSGWERGGSRKMRAPSSARSHGSPWRDWKEAGLGVDA